MNSTHPHSISVSCTEILQDKTHKKTFVINTSCIPIEIKDTNNNRADKNNNTKSLFFPIEESIEINQSDINQHQQHNKKSTEPIISKLFRHIFIDLALLSKLLRGKYSKNSNCNHTFKNNITCKSSRGCCEYKTDTTRTTTNNNSTITDTYKHQTHNTKQCCNQITSSNNIQLATRSRNSSKRKFGLFSSSNNNNNISSNSDSHDKYDDYDDSSGTQSPCLIHRPVTTPTKVVDTLITGTSPLSSNKSGRLLIYGATSNCISDYDASRLAHYQDPKMYDESGNVAATRPSRRNSNLSGYSISSLKDCNKQPDPQSPHEEQTQEATLIMQQTPVEFGEQGIFTDSEIILEGIELLSSPEDDHTNQNNEEEPRPDLEKRKSLIGEQEVVDIEFELELEGMCRRGSGRILYSRNGSKSSRTCPGGGEATGQGGGSKQGGDSGGEATTSGGNPRPGGHAAKYNYTGDSSGGLVDKENTSDKRDSRRGSSSFNFNNTNNSNNSSRGLNLPQNVQQQQQRQSQSPVSDSSERRHNPAGLRGCPFCWCCCCSCSCLNVQPRIEEPMRSQISIEPHSKFDAVSSEDKVTLEEAQKWAQNFDFLMQSKGGSKVFYEFLKLEYSEENILFYRAVEDLQSETNPDIIEEKAHAIYEDYISILSPKEVSLDSKVREVINTDMVEPTSSVFDEAQIQIYTLMQRDSYPRFINSKLYKEYLHTLGASSDSSRHSTGGVSNTGTTQSPNL